MLKSICSRAHAGTTNRINNQKVNLPAGILFCGQNKKMRNRLKIILLLFILYPGCNEIIDIAGVMVNRLNIQDPRPKEIIVSVKNSDSIFLPGFEITIKENYSFKCITSPKFTNSLLPVRFNLPDEQIEIVPENASGVSVFIFHPDFGKLMQEISKDNLSSSGRFQINFIFDIPVENLPKLRKSAYTGCD